jgi:hypothetical protein
VVGVEVDRPEDREDPAWAGECRPEARRRQRRSTRNLKLRQQKVCNNFRLHNRNNSKPFLHSISCSKLEFRLSSLRVKTEHNHRNNNSNRCNSRSNNSSRLNLLQQETLNSLASNLKLFLNNSYQHNLNSNLN